MPATRLGFCGLCNRERPRVAVSRKLGFAVCVEKLGIHNLVGLVKFAIRHGLSQL